MQQAGGSTNSLISLITIQKGALLPLCPCLLEAGSSQQSLFNCLASRSASPKTTKRHQKAIQAFILDMLTRH